ncbi:MAG: 3-oxoacyl-ACP reductase FabG [Gammaproteobacteria bacterium]|nr:3-oxoacyl-ACP reductase FabG [Gammaproteobacteria bacterium]
MTTAFDLGGEIALVTGASRGIGAAIADTLANAGARVIGTATTAAGAEQITRRLAAAPAPGRGVILDVADPTATSVVLKDIESREGAITILVNNAGIARDNLLMRMKDEDWQSVLDTNLTAVFRLSRSVLRGMLKARKGRIISIGSVVGTMGNGGQANYAAAKAGLTGLSKSLAREVGSRGVTVNVIAPGFITTDMTAALSDEQRAAMLAQIPLQRLGSGADVAHATLFLASAAGAYITGETLHVNGGMYMI